ncbi:serine/arginine repetitive matrix 2 [Holotrichia oblita]|uniref:Serine/arginine repetitive matrix 2 n=1 Tax=Holotrichia oblita TaxID=644536 RepID=A0ACB9T7P4_HOLOL|nr:serine/arginine repetitive matrix 2 [Holotrichia oblita]
MKREGKGKTKMVTEMRDIAMFPTVQFKQNYSNDMASRDKKVSVNRKQSTASPVPPKEGATPPETLTKSIIARAEASVADEAPKLTSIRNPRSNASKNNATSLTRKIKKKPASKVIKKNVALKAKNKSKLNQKLGKKLLANSRNNFEVKQSLLRNGIKSKVTRKAKSTQNVKKEQSDDSPPVLEPIYPIHENTKQNKKKPKKEDDKKVKEESNDSFSTLDEALDNLLNQCSPQIKTNKKKLVRKIKSEPDSSKESIDDVINDLTTLIKVEEIKSEVDSDIEKLELKARRPLKNTKLDLLRKLKKEHLESKFEAENKVIDMLDLNVDKRRNNKIVRNRRHSIEKYPIGCTESNVANLAVFSNTPRSISPRAKRASKVRQSIDLSTSKRSSPYTTRSDSPARILRNGKHRKLKDLNLLEGLDGGYRKRRRLCSDYSGSEISVSKSGYESDSSFSDLASLHGAENSDNFDLKSDIKKDFTELSPIQNHDNSTMKTVKLDSVIKRSLSMEAAGDATSDQNLPPGKETIDTNFNVCDTESKLDVNKEEHKDNPQNAAKIDLDEDEYIDTIVSPSAKVPEKSIILDIMKQTFNNDVSNSEQDKEKRATRSSTKKGGNDEKETITNARTDDPNTIQIQAIENEDKILNGDHEKKEEVNKSMEIEEASAENEKLHSEEVIETEEPAEELVKITNENDKQAVEIETNSIETTPKKIEIVETPESLAIKESILQALGLQSLRAAEEAKQKSKERLVPKNDNYTGTLKTVIKLNRNDKKRGKTSLKMTLQKSKKGNSSKEETDFVKGDEESLRHMKEGGTSSTWKTHGSQSSDTAGALRKSHYANRSNMDASSEHTSDGDTAATEDGAGKNLVIPEKASSFSIHPGRLCKDECSYCFGKFGLFDTPCHIAQMKSVERQDKILSVEKHLTRDSCLCDACYRHVDRKTNTPSYANNKAFKRSTLVTTVPKHNLCHVLGCKNESTTNIRRKWAIKVKNICKVININLDNPGLHLVPICEEHFNALEHLMTCAMCKRKLARNHIHYLGSEASELNEKLNGIGIPVKFGDKPVICKFCKYFATLLLTSEDERPENSSDFYKEYTKRLLHYHDVEHMDDAEAEEPIPVPAKDKCEKDLINKNKKKKVCKPATNTDPLSLDRQTDSAPSSIDQNNVPSSESREESPDYMVDYNTLIPSIAIECASNDAEKKDAPKKQILLKKIPRPESIKEAVEISKNLKLKNKSDIAVQRLGSNPSISVRQLFPGEEDLPLQGCVDFHNVKERTPEGWEKCSSTIQFDLDTKQLWQELQKPYGNQSSFLRHLILLEKYFRNGDLVLSPNASHHSVNYSESVQNRLRAYDNTPSSSGPIQPLSMIPFNKPQKSSSGIITSRDNTPTVGVINAANIPKNTPITITQLSNSNFIMNSNIPNNNTNSNNNNNSNNKPKTPGVPPGLMPLQPGTSKPVAPLVKVPQPQKIKFPITKNWRPNLIPIDPTKKPEKKPGLVQVISGGKPYHITLEDYKKMCAIKRTFDLKQKKLQDAQKAKLEPQKIITTPSPNSLLKTMVPRKSLIISKTSTITSPRGDQNLSENEREESSLEKLDRQVEKLEAKFGEAKSVMILPKIPKSLTVIPQTVSRKPSRSSSPALQITPKPNIILPSSKS